MMRQLGIYDYDTTHNHRGREPRIKRDDAFQIFDLFRRQGYIKCLEVPIELLDFAPSNEGNDVRRFLHKR